MNAFDRALDWWFSIKFRWVVVIGLAAMVATLPLGGIGLGLLATPIQCVAIAGVLSRPVYFVARTGLTIARGIGHMLGLDHHPKQSPGGTNAPAPSVPTPSAPEPSAPTPAPVINAPSSPPGLGGERVGATQAEVPGGALTIGSGGSQGIGRSDTLYVAYIGDEHESLGRTDVVERAETVLKARGAAAASVERITTNWVESITGDGQLTRSRIQGPLEGAAAKTSWQVAMWQPQEPGTAVVWRCDDLPTARRLAIDLSRRVPYLELRVLRVSRTAIGAVLADGTVQGQGLRQLQRSSAAPEAALA